jgi:ribosome-associated heat shock protein Hsp15
MAELAAEKGETSDEFPEEHTSGVKAHIDSIALLPGIKSPAYRATRFSATSEGVTFKTSPSAEFTGRGLYDNTSMPSVRIDKWLSAARFFKTRALAQKACDLGRIHSNGIQAKPAREVRVGDMLLIRNEGGEFNVEFLQLSEMRGPAAVAQTLYRETEASKEARLKLAAERKAMQEFAPLPERRPSKRDRRRIIQFRGER